MTEHTEEQEALAVDAQRRDALVKEMDARTAEHLRRAAFIQSLRDFAAFLEQHPAVKAPRYVNINSFVNTRDEVAAQARAASWEKVWNGDWFYLRKEFGDHLTFDVATDRATICRKVVTGTRTVEAQPERVVEEFTWECDEPSLLAEVK